jgi:hypothetical protein
MEAAGLGAGEDVQDVQGVQKYMSFVLSTLLLHE